MKRIATILLLALLIFNFVGYRLLISVLQQKATNSIVAKIDSQDYNDAELITVTVPLSMPYIQDSKDFERKDGEITLSGKVYHYVKQKIEQGSLVLMCLPDEQKTHLQNAKDDFFRLANELQSDNSASKKSGEAHVVKLTISDYEELQVATSDFYSTPISKSFPSFSFYALLKGEGIMPEQPPEA